MFYAVIIDDEQIIREGLCKHIKRAFSDLSVIGSFSDGKDAIKFLENNYADIVITDIRMSEKSGIDVAKYLSENAPETKVVFLSGYQEFDYARQALQYNVKYYLSKPVKLSELNDVLNELIQKLCNEQKTRDDAIKESEYLQMLFGIVKRDFYSDILIGVLNEKETLLSRAEKIRLDIDSLYKTQCAIFSFTISTDNECYYGNDELNTCISNLLRELRSVISTVVLIQENHETIYVSEFSGFNSVEELSQSLSEDLKKLSESAAELFGIKLNYELLFCGKDIFSLMEYSNPNSSKFSVPALLEDKFKTLLSKILARDYHGAQDILNTLRLYSQSLPINDSRNLMARLFKKLCSGISNDFNLPESLFYEADNQQELFEEGNKALNSIFELVSSSDDIDNPTISKAKKYMTEHLSDDIGLDDIAGFVYLNPVYFSRFFKQHTGMTMTDYLTNMRISKACEMLKGHRHKIHEISSACGYKSSKYFAKIFKQYTGQTPSEYSKTN